MSKQAFVIENKYKVQRGPITLDHTTLLELATHMETVELGPDDIQKWFAAAKHGESFKIRYGMHLLCLDLEAVCR
jgi:hypothetical protein